MNKQYGVKSEWKDHPIYNIFYKHASNHESNNKVEWLADEYGEVIGISIPLSDGTYKSYRRMFKGYDQITRDIFEEMFNKAE